MKIAATRQMEIAEKEVGDQLTFTGGEKVRCGSVQANTSIVDLGLSLVSRWQLLPATLEEPSANMKPP